MQRAVLATVNPSVCLSVRPSVTLWHCVNMTHAAITGSSLQDSPMTLVSSRLTSARNSKGNIASGGEELERGRNKKLSYRRETARQLPTSRGLSPPVHSASPSGYTYAYGRIRNPQQTYAKRAVRKAHFKLNRAFNRVVNME